MTETLSKIFDSSSFLVKFDTQVSFSGTQYTEFGFKSTKLVAECLSSKSRVYRVLELGADFTNLCLIVA